MTRAVLLGNARVPSALSLRSSPCAGTCYAAVVRVPVQLGRLLGAALIAAAVGVAAGCQGSATPRPAIEGTDSDAAVDASTAGRVADGAMDAAPMQLDARARDAAPGPTDGAAGARPTDARSDARSVGGAANDAAADAAPGDAQPPGTPRTYSTSFDADENPIREGGAWSAIARPWLRVRSAGGLAKPDAFVTGYNDNYTMLSGFGPDVEITATVYIAGSAPFGEILLLARMAHTATSLRGYEFLYDGDGSVQLMRWNGGSGEFSAIGGEQSNPGALRDQDQLRMRIAGDTIAIFHRRPPGAWQQIGLTHDATFADGQPGFGFFVRDEGQSIDDIGLRDYSVTELD